MKHTIMMLLATLAVSGVVRAGPVNVNTADAATLAAELEGIGDSRARAIVAWREAHGRFDTVDDLQQVKGIGKKIIRLNAGNIRFEDPQAASR